MRPSFVHILILVLVIVVIFGAAKLPMVAKNLGKSMKVFKNEVKDLRDDDGKETEAKEITDAKHHAAPASDRLHETRSEGESRPDDRR